MKAILNKILSAFILLFLAVILFTSLVFLVKYFLVTLSGLHEPVLKWLKMILSEEKIKNSLLFQVITVCKIFSIFIAGSFIFIVYSALSTVFSCIFYKICSRNYKKIQHPLKFSLLKGMKWNFYRTFLVLAPPLSVLIAGILLFVSSIIFFNIFLKIAGISISLTTFLMSFISFSMGFLFLFSLLISLYQLITTIYGTEIAVSEPKLSNVRIESRAKKLIFSKNYNIFLCMGYLVFIYNLIIQIKYGLTTDILTNPANHEILSYIIGFNLFCFAILEYLKASSYITLLIEHSKKISKSPIKVFKD